MKTEKRPFEQLTDGEKKIVHDVDQYGHTGIRCRGVSASGPVDLARKVTGENIQQSDQIGIDYTNLCREGWIVGNGLGNFGTRLYTASPDYQAQLVHQD